MHDELGGCLELGIKNSEYLEENPAHLGGDVGIFSLFSTMAGPVDATFKSGKRWHIYHNLSVIKTFNKVEKLDLQNEYD